jgi:hypothetical protein
MVSIIILSIMGVLLGLLFIGRAIEMLLPKIRERRSRLTQGEEVTTGSMPAREMSGTFTRVEHT